MELKQFNNINKNELAMVNVAYAILENTKTVTAFNDLLAQVSEYLEYDDEQIEEGMVQFYTDLNVDGRFISLGENRWALREWYAVDSIDEELTHDNDIEELKPKISDDGFDDFENLEKEYNDVDKAEKEDEDEEIEYGDRVGVDTHGVMVDEESDEDLGEYKEEIEDIEEDDEDLEGLSIVDDEDVLEETEEEDEEE